MKMRVADYIAAYMSKQGVKAAFMVSGGGMMHLIDAVGKHPGMNYYCNHHEQASAMAAEGYARQSGSIGLCYVTSGPGATNTVTGIAGSWLDSVPCLFLTGQSNVKQTIQGSKMESLRQFGTFEVNIVPIVKSITKYAAFIDRPESIKYHLEKAVFLAQEGRPGPVLLDIPLNIQGAMIDPDLLEGYEPPASVKYSLYPTCVDLLNKLRSYERPVILAGHGIRAAGAVEAFKELVSVLGIPVLTTQLAKDALPYDNALFVGHPGVKGDRAGNFAIQNADFVLSVGSSLHTQTTGYELDMFAVNAYKVQVELDDAILKRENVGVNQKIKTDVTGFMADLLKAAQSMGYKHKNSAWNKTCVGWKEQYAVFKEPHDLEKGGINFYEFAEVLSNVSQGNETIVTDAGSAFYVMGQAFRLKADQRYIVSGAFGAMGYALPASIGAAVNANTPVVCVTGDGSLQMNIQELQTLRHNQFSIKLFIINNDGYLSIRNTQDTFFNGHHVGSDGNSGVSLPEISKIAEAYHIPYLCCENREELTSRLQETLEHAGPIICEIMCKADQKIIPAVSSKKREDGSMVSMPIDDMFPFLSRAELDRNRLKPE